MEPEKKSNSQTAILEVKRKAVRLHKEHHRSIVEWATITICTLLGTLLSLAVSAASSSSFSTSMQIRRSYVLFLGGILGFQTILIFVIWTFRKRNRRIVQMKAALIDVYLSAIYRSSLNPNLKS